MTDVDVCASLTVDVPVSVRIDDGGLEVPVSVRL